MLPESTTTFSCPCCGEKNTAFIDSTEGPVQEWVTDCEVCCRPVIVSVRLDDDRIEIDARPESD